MHISCCELTKASKHYMLKSFEGHVHSRNTCSMENIKFQPLKEVYDSWFARIVAQGVGRTGKTCPTDKKIWKEQSILPYLRFLEKHKEKYEYILQNIIPTWTKLCYEVTRLVTTASTTLVLSTKSEIGVDFSSYFVIDFSKYSLNKSSSDSSKPLLNGFIKEFPQKLYCEIL